MWYILYLYMQVDNIESSTLNTNNHVNPIIICTAQRHKTLQFTTSNINMQCDYNLYYKYKLLISIKSKFLRAYYWHRLQARFARMETRKLKQFCASRNAPQETKVRLYGRYLGCRWLPDADSKQNGNLFLRFSPSQLARKFWSDSRARSQKKECASSAIRCGRATKNSKLDWENL